MVREDIITLAVDCWSLSINYMVTTIPYKFPSQYYNVIKKTVG